jgi:hypothetical protein
MMAENPDDLLSPEQIAAEIGSAGIPLTAGSLHAMINAARAEASTKAAEARAVKLFPLNPMLPSHVSYEVGRRAAASGALRAEKLGGDWFTTEADVAAWLTASGKWFDSESAVQKWHADIARLARWWIP